MHTCPFTPSSKLIIYTGITIGILNSSIMIIVTHYSRNKTKQKIGLLVICLVETNNFAFSEMLDEMLKLGKF